MKKIEFNNIEYELIEDYKNGFEKESVEEKMTEYFEPFDYILGDWSYGKLRLKGFCDKANKIHREINDIKNIVSVSGIKIDTANISEKMTIITVRMITLNVIKERFNVILMIGKSSRFLAVLIVVKISVKSLLFLPILIKI